MSAATLLFEAYGEDACLYEIVLGVSKDATPSQLRKAYYKRCLTYHPDKLSPDLSNDKKELAKNKFQAISLAYTILSDEEKRKEYDESGDLYDDDDDLASSKSGMKQWTEYFESLFPKVTAVDIDAFEVKYKCSDEEEKDVLKYYTQFKGDLNKMLECVMLSSDADKQRWATDYIEPAIESGDVDDFAAKIKKTLGSAPTKKSKRKASGKKKAEKVVEMEESDSGSDYEESGSDSETPVAEIVDEEMEEEEDEEEEIEESNKSKKKAPAKRESSTSKLPKPCKKKKSSGEEDLYAQIRGNRAGFDSLMAGLEDRYGGGKKKRVKEQHKKDESDIDDDEFEKIQARLMKNKRPRKKS